MECCICLDSLVKETGVYTSSCGHLFHLGCIGRWILKNESCPYCRHEFVEKEKIAEDEEESEEEEEDYDADEDEQSFTGQGLRWRRTESGRWRVFTGQHIPEFDPEVHALWVMRKTFEMLENEQSIAVIQTKEAVTEPLLDYEALYRLEREYDTE
jgi:hypothetical protein